MKFLFLNLTLNAEKVEFTLRKPFNFIFDFAGRQQWCPRRDLPLSFAERASPTHKVGGREPFSLFTCDFKLSEKGLEPLRLPIRPSNVRVIFYISLRVFNKTLRSYRHYFTPLRFSFTENLRLGIFLTAPSIKVIKDLSLS